MPNPVVPDKLYPRGSPLGLPDTLSRAPLPSARSVRVARSRARSRRRRPSPRALPDTLLALRYFWTNTLSEADFSLAALHTALEVRRQELGFSWAAAMRDINRGVRLRPVSSSTVARLRTGHVAEADGVLQMLRWLGRAPESFIPGFPADRLDAARLPGIDDRLILRFDTRKLYDVLNIERRSRGLTWQALARETRVPGSPAQGLRRGGRTSFPSVTRLTRWLDRPAAEFTFGSRR